MFQLFSHKTLYDDNHPDIFRSTKYAPRHKKTHKKKNEKKEQPNSSAIHLMPMSPSNNPSSTDVDSSPTETAEPIVNTANGDIEAASSNAESIEVEEPQMSVGLTIGLLAVVTVVSILHVVSCINPC